MYVPLPEKVILRTNKELLELHKRVVLNYLIQEHNMKLRARNKFFTLYDMYISEKNIRLYFFRPVKVFVHALVTDNLDKIQDYFTKT